MEYEKIHFNRETEVTFYEIGFIAENSFEGLIVWV